MFRKILIWFKLQICLFRSQGSARLDEEIADMDNEKCQSDLKTVESADDVDAVEGRMFK